MGVFMDVQKWKMDMSDQYNKINDECDRYKQIRINRNELNQMCDKINGFVLVSLSNRNKYKRYCNND